MSCRGQNQMKQNLPVRNFTHDATAWATSPVGRLARIEVLVAISCALLTMLVLLGSGRRATHSSALRFAVWSALMLSYPAVSYTIGLMQSASFRNELMVAWGCFLLLLLGTADGIAAYSLNDSGQQARTILNQALQVIYIFLLLLSYVGSLPLQLKVLLLLFLALSAAKLGMRIRSFLLDGRDRVLIVDNKLIADYMSREHGYSGPDYEATTMRGYKYVVAGEELNDGERGIDPDTNPNLVTIDKVWQCQGSLLRSDPDEDADEDAAGGVHKHRDLCLSFALFKLLRRRLGRYLLEESCLNKTRDLVKLGLLAGDDHERMYRVVEVELGFLFDFYYARYRSPKETLTQDTVLFAAVLATSLCTLFSSAVLDYRAPQGYPNIVTTRFDIWLTRFIIVLFLILESFQYFALVFSDWHKVKMLCRYVLDEAWQNSPFLEGLLRMMCRVRLTPYWSNSVGQYSLLHASLRYEQGHLSCVWGMPLPKSIVAFLIHRRMTHRRKLSVAVKRSIYLFMKTGLTRIQNGEYTLQRSGMLDSFYGAIAQANTTQTIMIWHIATAICDSKSQLNRADSTTKENHEVATTLSAYCAYLMLSAPELLPDHSYDTQLLLEGVQLKAREKLKGCQSKDDICKKLPDSQCNDTYVDILANGSDTYENILANGKRLGNEILQKMPETAKRWRVLAMLWVEMLLSLAPSDNATCHIQKLATGGELITHLWALLTHAGIIAKPMSQFQRKGP